MPKGLLSDGQQAQVINLIKDKKTNEEIVAFFKTSYHVDIPKTVIYSLRYKLNKNSGKVGAGSKQPHHRRAGKIAGRAVDQTSTDSINKLVDQLRAELEAYSKFVIGKIRIELVKVVGEARQKRIDVGEDVEVFEAPEVEDK